MEAERLSLERPLLGRWRRAPFSHPPSHFAVVALLKRGKLGLDLLCLPSKPAAPSTMTRDHCQQEGEGCQTSDGKGHPSKRIGHGFRADKGCNGEEASRDEREDIACDEECCDDGRDC